MEGASEVKEVIDQVASSHAEPVLESANYTKKY